jgi:hypothetical protein
MRSLQTFETGTTKSPQKARSFGGQEKASSTGLCQISQGHSEHTDDVADLADARKHVDGRSEVADVEDGQGELDVSVMPNTFCRFFTTSQTLSALLVRTLVKSA